MDQKDAIALALARWHRKWLGKVIGAPEWRPDDMSDFVDIMCDDIERQVLGILSLGDSCTDLDGQPFCETGYAQRYHAIGECDCPEELPR